ncbi:MAG: hypothetical protein EAZ92_09500 [Candidatus Kapaibacterium sp.]|nr:MAG: hypothetical protein EAZ92_09500 [Candidatus Kapabacteria bacterium]
MVKKGSSSQDIDVANVAQGAYFLTVSKGNRAFIEKIRMRIKR